MIPISRRNFCVAGSMLAVTGMTSGLLLTRWGNEIAAGETVIGGILKHNFPQVRFAAAELLKFTRMFVAYDHTDPHKLRALAPLMPVVYDNAARHLIPIPLYTLFDDFQRRVVTAFAQATDFDLSLRQQTVHYVASCDPYLNFVANRLCTAA